MSDQRRKRPDTPTSGLAGRVIEIEVPRDRDGSFDPVIVAKRQRVLGKGRKNRATPLTSEVAALLRQWITERGGQSEGPLFPTRQGRALSRYTVGLLVTKHCETAAASCPSLKIKRVTPLVLRHTAAMLWRAKGVDIAKIALLFGHESVQTAHIYEHADLALKEEAIGRTAPLGIKPGRYRASDTLLAYLESL